MSSSLKELLGRGQLERVRLPLEQAWTLPPVAYTSPVVFEAEVASIFNQDWLCVARVEQLPNPGDYVCADLPTQPIVVTRDQDGELHAFSRICLHRAMPLVDSAGHGTRFTCPYHNWTYELDGRLRSAPLMDGASGFVTGECRLPALQLEVWQGFIFVNMNGEAAPLGPRLKTLERHIENYGLAQLVIADTIEFDSPWNWKILVENFMEAYHHIGTHKDTFEPIYPARDSSVEDNDNAPWMLLRMPGESGAEGLPPLPNLSQSQQNELLAMAIFPTMLFAANAAMVFWYQLEPTACDSMRLRIHVLMPPEVVQALSEEERAEITETVSFIHMQDIDVNAGPWRGLNAALTGQGRLSPYEKAIWQINQRWLDELGLD